VLATLNAIPTPQAGSARPSRIASRTTTLAIGSLAAVALVALAAWLVIRTLSVGSTPTIGTLTHVTREPGLELDPAISPDGRTLAYVAGPTRKRRLYVRQIDGGRPIPLTDEGMAETQRRPDWSPDGSRIAFQAGQQGIGVRNVQTGAIYTIPALGGTPTLLVPPTQNGVAVTPSWSPKGDQIAYAAEDGIYVVAAQPGGTPKRILSSLKSVNSPRWSPDGLSLVYVSGGTYFSVGEDMLGNTDTSAIHVITLATGADRAITTGEWLDVSPCWTPDGRGLLFVSSRGGGRDVYLTRLSRSGGAGAAERVTSGLNAHSISLSKDGRLLAYSSLSFRANIWSAPILPNGVATTADASQVTFGSEKTEKLVVSPDGRFLAYDSDRSGNADVWKLRIGDTEPQQMTRDPAPEVANDWSPDGREILFHTIRAGTGRDVLSISADGTRTQVLVATSAEEQHGAWSPDGNSLAFSRADSVAEEYDVYVMTRARKDAAWGPPRRLTTDNGADAKWSPDGRAIIYIRKGEVRLMDADGANNRSLVTPLNLPGQLVPQYAMWSRDGQAVYVKAADSESHASLWSVPVTGGTPRLLMRMDDPSRPSLRREFATDGTRFYFTIAQDESDVWVAQIR